MVLLANLANLDRACLEDSLNNFIASNWFAPRGSWNPVAHAGAATRVICFCWAGSLCVVLAGGSGQKAIRPLYSNDSVLTEKSREPGWTGQHAEGPGCPRITQSKSGGSHLLQPFPMPSKKDSSSLHSPIWTMKKRDLRRTILRSIVGLYRRDRIRLLAGDFNAAGEHLQDFLDTFSADHSGVRGSHQVVCRQDSQAILFNWSAEIPGQSSLSRKVAGRSLERRFNLFFWLDREGL